MKTFDSNNSRFVSCVAYAAEALRNCEMEKAYELIIEAMTLKPSAAEPHNLLGIWFEISGNEDMARRHYRAAYSLDPTYKPACNNLEQICAMFNYFETSYDYGDEGEAVGVSKKAI